MVTLSLLLLTILPWASSSMTSNPLFPPMLAPATVEEGSGAKTTWVGAASAVMLNEFEGPEESEPSEAINV